MVVVGLSGKRGPKRRQIGGRRARGRLVATMGRINACGMVWATNGAPYVPCWVVESVNLPQWRMVAGGKMWLNLHQAEGGGRVAAW